MQRTTDRPRHRRRRSPVCSRQRRGTATQPRARAAGVCKRQPSRAEPQPAHDGDLDGYGDGRVGGLGDRPAADGGARGESAAESAARVFGCVGGRLVGGSGHL